MGEFPLAYIITLHLYAIPLIRSAIRDVLLRPHLGRRSRTTLASRFSFRAFPMPFNKSIYTLVDQVEQELTTMYVVWKNRRHRWS